jgi:YidC/Oxa1 family membrane protein insertase
MTDQRNLILAIALSVGIILAFQFFYELPRLREMQARQAAEAERLAATAPAETGAAATGAGAVAGTPGSPAEALAVASAQRIRIDNGRLHGTLNTQGGRIDDITLADYRETVDPNSPEIVLLSPAGRVGAYFGEFGWVAQDPAVPVPGAETVWAADGERVGRDQPVTLRWDNGQGLAFEKAIRLDGDFMFTIDRRVTNNGTAPVTLFPYALVSRWGTPHTAGFFILHEGPIGVLGGKLQEPNYKDLVGEGNKVQLESSGGWLGFADKYWLTALVPDQAQGIKGTFQHSKRGEIDLYQADYLGPPLVIAPGQTLSYTDRFFAGAKEVDKLDHYRDTYNIPLFDRAVDFGWFYFLTKPLFYILDAIYRFVGNYGVAILCLTLLVKLVLFPLANKSYKSMSAMKKLQPEMEKLRERFADDRAKMQQELMALYKREKVNPVSGCLPILVQIPVFFALYKVLFVSIEMRHAPFFGWIKDLSAPDPTSIFNLFGLIPWQPPLFLMIGIWPLIMGFTMWLQQRMNPQPTDPVQAKVMSFLPILFTFMLATFPAGLVIYWAWNNTLSVAQQWVIMRRMGVKIG